MRHTFQSRFGKAEWLQPYTDKTIAALAEEGVKRLAVITPGFAADCVETLEEIAMQGKESSSSMAARILPLCPASTIVAKGCDSSAHTSGASCRAGFEADFSLSWNFFFVNACRIGFCLPFPSADNYIR